MHQLLTRLVLYLLTFELFVALATQALGLFTVGVVWAIHLMALIGVVAWFWRTRPTQPKLERPELGLLVVVVIAGAMLWQVHYRYDGAVATALEPGYTVHENYSYTYPYFSDEWYAIAFAQQSIETGQLPLTFPLTRIDEPFRNFEAPFHALVAELLLLFGLNPLEHYVGLSLGFGVGVVASLYLLLRQLAAEQVPAAAAALLALFIVNGANLPGLWTLLPVVSGALALLLTLAMIVAGRQREALMGSFVTLLLYPPLVVFLIPVWLLVGVTTRHWRAVALFFGSLLAAALIMAGLYFFGSLPAGQNVVTFVHQTWTTAIAYSSYQAQGIPSYPLWGVVPWATLVLAAVGSFVAWRRHAWWLMVASALGLLYWLIYSQTNARFIIDYQRVVFMTSLLLTVLAGLGAQQLWKTLSKRLVHQVPYLSIIGLIAVLAVFGALVPGYTNQDQWQRLVLVTDEGSLLPPKAPANQYLTPEDLELFSDVHGERFLSHPWKGTVVGVATGNHPLEIKGGTITFGQGRYAEFNARDCAHKAAMAEGHGFVYAYVPSLTCADWQPVGRSAEGLQLYRYDP